MEKLTHTAVTRGILLTLLGACGALLSIVWPVGQKAFCSGISGILL